MTPIKTGFYRHFKGARYHVIGTAFETGEELVVYEKGRLYCRPKEMFEGFVDGRKRFVFENSAEVTVDNGN